VWRNREEEVDVARLGEFIVARRGGGGECDAGEDEVSVARRGGGGCGGLGEVIVARQGEGGECGAGEA